MEIDPNDATTFNERNYIDRELLKGKPWRFVISHVEKGQCFNKQTKKSDERAILHFSKYELKTAKGLGLVINKTKNAVLIEALGTYVPDWKGAVVELSPGRGNQNIDLRVLKKPGARQPDPTEAPDPEPPEDIDDELSGEAAE